MSTMERGFILEAPLKLQQKRRIGCENRGARVQELERQPADPPRSEEPMVNKLLFYAVYKHYWLVKGQTVPFEDVGGFPAVLKLVLEWTRPVGGGNNQRWFCVRVGRQL